MFRALLISCVKIFNNNVADKRSQLCAGKMTLCGLAEETKGASGHPIIIMMRYVDQCWSLNQILLTILTNGIAVLRDTPSWLSSLSVTSMCDFTVTSICFSETECITDELCPELRNVIKLFLGEETLVLRHSRRVHSRHLWSPPPPPPHSSPRHSSQPELVGLVEVED